MNTVLIITHAHIGESMLAAVEQTYGHLSMPAESICVHANSDPDECLKIAEKIIRHFGEGCHCLVFTDMIGSTPSNIAHKLHNGESVFVISGLNLAMLLRVFNYPDLSARELVEKALSAGREGVNCEC